MYFGNFEYSIILNPPINRKQNKFNKCIFREMKAERNNGLYQTTVNRH